jgi:hypothetical protein
MFNVTAYSVRLLEPEIETSISVGMKLTPGTVRKTLIQTDVIRFFLDGDCVAPKRR